MDQTTSSRARNLVNYERRLNIGMSKDEDKIKHSRRLLKDDNAIKKQSNIAKAHGFQHRPEHRYAKMHAVNCGDPNCAMCGNPRKFFKEPTVQEKRLFQDIDTPTDRKSNGLKTNE